MKVLCRLRQNSWNTIRKENRILIIGFLSLLAIMANIYCHSLGVQIICSHLYYLPIIVSTVWYPRRGLYYSLFLTLTYICTVVYFAPDLLILISAGERAIILAGIAILAALLSDALQEREARYKSVFQITPAPVFVLETDGTIVDISESVENILGYSREELINQKFFRLPFIPENSREFLQDTQEEIQKGVPIEPYTFQLYSKSGQIRSFTLYSALIRIKTGEVTGSIYSLADVTDLIQVTKALQKSGQLLTNVINGSPIPMFVIGNDHKITHWNSAISKFTSIPPDTIIGTTDSWKAFYSGKRACLADILVDGNHEELDKWYDGEYHTSELIEDAYEVTEFFPSLGENGKWLHCTAALIRDADGSCMGAIETLYDITEQKQAEEYLRYSLNEKTTLLKEIHHRVKNNLQIVSSILKLHDLRAEDVKTHAIMRECRNQVFSMAMIHEKLYLSESFQEITLIDYLHKLSTHLHEEFGLTNEHVGITVRGDWSIRVDVETGIPCGLIVNELITNAFKYAFPPGEKGEITIDLQKYGNNAFILRVSDNGIGMPESIGFNTTETLGMQLVGNLISQLKGTIELHRNHGTEFIMEIPLRKQEGTESGGNDTKKGAGRRG